MGDINEALVATAPTMTREEFLHELQRKGLACTQNAKEHVVLTRILLQEVSTNLKSVYKEAIIFLP